MTVKSRLGAQMQTQRQAITTVMMVLVLRVTKGQAITTVPTFLLPLVMPSSILEHRSQQMLVSYWWQHMSVDISFQRVQQMTSWSWYPSTAQPQTDVSPPFTVCKHTSPHMKRLTFQWSSTSSAQSAMFHFQLWTMYLSAQIQLVRLLLIKLQCHSSLSFPSWTSYSRCLQVRIYLLSPTLISL